MTRAPEGRRLMPRAVERDVVRLQNAVTRRTQADATVAQLVDRLRAADVPWSLIASLLGVTKQAAQQRYGGE